MWEVANRVNLKRIDSPKVSESYVILKSLKWILRLLQRLSMTACKLDSFSMTEWGRFVILSVAFMRSEVSKPRESNLYKS